MPKSVAESVQPAGSDAGGPDVIVDFIFDDGLLFVAVQNIGDKPAHKVAVQFDPPFRGVEGTCAVSEMALFRNIEFLAPWKEIVTFLDSSASYFARREPTRIAATVSWRDAAGRKHSAAIQHDLEIYRNIGYVRKTGGQAAPCACRADSEEA
jgi:hypothetical protein